ncbi:hypothetical protein EJK48_0667 [Moraxella catarrhalis]|nr:hypothetical protein EJK48_0667 [Moraxella catarrhalis]RUO14722.1 hypothetical protein EJK49_1868 [Moraxella catarrhalis]
MWKIITILMLHDNHLLKAILGPQFSHKFFKKLCYNKAIKQATI